MTVKDLRDYLNGLDLDCVQPHINVVSVTHEADGDYCQVDILEDFILDAPDAWSGKGFLYFYTDEACSLIDEDKEEDENGVE